MANGYEALGYALGGGYASDREERRKALQLQAATQGMQFDEKGNLGYMPGSKQDLQAKEIEMLKQSYQDLESRYVRQDTWNAVEAGVKDGNYNQFNSFLNSSPKVKSMYQEMGVQSVETFDPYNDEHLRAYQQAGFNPDVIQYIKEAREGKIPNVKPEDIRNAAKSLGTAYPLVRGTDNSFYATSIDSFAAQTNIIKNAIGDEKRKMFYDAIANGQQALTGITQQARQYNEEKQRLANEAMGISNQVEQVKLNDMQRYLEENPGSSLADYMATMKAKASGASTDTAEMKNLKFESEQTGIPIEELIRQKREQKAQQTKTAKMKDTEFNTGKWNTIKQESNTKDIAEVDYTKLSDENRIWFDEQARVQAQDIKPEERSALFSLSSAADKLDINSLKETTGILDATFNDIFDRLGLDLPDEELVQSSNYNLIKNAIIKAAMGSQVTGNELERMTAQLGTEFRADKTVRVKMAETLDNLVAKYEEYKVSAPAFYARAMKEKVDNMKTMSNYLRSNGKEEKPSGTTTETKPTLKEGTVVNGYRFKGGDYKDKNNWEKVK